MEANLYCVMTASVKYAFLFRFEIRALTFVLLTYLVSGCTNHSTQRPLLFTTLPSSVTGITSNNTLVYNEAFNPYTFRNFYNGGGVGIGDINNDNLPDVFICLNQQSNRLYLNKGNLKFEDITFTAGVTSDSVWSTGVTMADVNGDGWIDIYVCKSGDLKGKNRSNELYINNGNLTFSPKAKEYGLDNRGLSTHAAFFDYDNDGDLDCYLLNNSFKSVGNFDLVANQRNIIDSLGGNKLFRNDNNKFKDVSHEAGIYSSKIGFGLGVTVSDLNKDGWQDIYVSNDFFERDYLYLNKRDGTFAETLPTSIHELSMNSMGADIADINNDGYSDIYVTDMLPETEARIKTKTNFENWNKYQSNIKSGYHKQFVRNTLQLNNGTSTDKGDEPIYFSEIGRFSGVEATDWSWGALISDLDNDGNKDIFVANGIYKDITDQDYIQYTANSSNEIRQKIINKEKNIITNLIDLIPSNPISNYVYSNNGDLTFTNKALAWGLDEPGFSNGSAYGDLDNDGDLDLVINNVDMPTSVYRNESVQQHPENKFLKVSLQGQGRNTSGIGSKVTVYYNKTLSYQEQMPMRGFESTVDARMNFGLGKTNTIDSVVVHWPDSKQQVLKNVKINSHIVLRQKDAVKPNTYESKPPTKIFSRSENTYGLDFIHRENEFVDFDRDKLIFNMLSHEGPRMAKGDINGDSREDIYICGAKDQPGALYEQMPSGNFKKSNVSLLEQDSVSEDTDALFFDADGDKDQDLYVCSGGNEFSSNATALIDRLYINDGHGKFHKSNQVLPSYIFESTSCARAGDYDKDGDLDLFVGVRLKPFRYGYPCKGYILENDGHGQFKDVTEHVAPALKEVGMVTDAAWLDYDKDGDDDLAITGEYMPVKIFKNQNGKLAEFTEQAGLGKSNGWWNRLQVADLNNDGYPDLIGANHGLNSKFTASETKPVRMHVGDFDNNGGIEHIVSCYNGQESYPLALKHDMVSAMPSLKKRYLKYDSYKEQRIEDIFKKEELAKAIELSAYHMESSVMLNNLNGRFLIKALPWQAQLAPMYGILADDFDRDGKLDILLGGNFYESKPEVGIYDASYGVLLKGDGTGEFRTLPMAKSGMISIGAVRDIISIKSENRDLILVSKNNEKLQIFTLDALQKK